jgi:hypothetical protein
MCASRHPLQWPRAKASMRRPWAAAITENRGEARKGKGRKTEEAKPCGSSSQSLSRPPWACPAPLREVPSITPSAREPREINRASMNMPEALYRVNPRLTSRWMDALQPKKNPAEAGLW